MLLPLGTAGLSRRAVDCLPAAPDRVHTAATSLPCFQRPALLRYAVVWPHPAGQPTPAVLQCPTCHHLWLPPARSGPAHRNRRDAVRAAGCCVGPARPPAADHAPGAGSGGPCGLWARRRAICPSAASPPAPGWHPWLKHAAGSEQNGLNERRLHCHKVARTTLRRRLGQGRDAAPCGRLHACAGCGQPSGLVLRWSLLRGPASSPADCSCRWCRRRY